jgi:hypothetical protein
MNHDDDIERVAEAIYMTHWRVPDLDGGQRPSPVWSNASDAVKKWTRAQAKSAIAAYDAEPAPFNDGIPELW